MNKRYLVAAAVALAVGGCASMPTGPSQMVLPGSTKTFDQFRVDDSNCRQFAYEQVSGRTPARAQEEAAVRSAAIGTAVGALAGAAIDGSSGAAAGAGVGLLMGGLVGAGAADQSGYDAQRRYDHSYQQCMYAKGHRIPVSGRFAQTTQTQAAPVPAPRRSYPPPPPSSGSSYPPPPAPATGAYPSSGNPNVPPPGSAPGY